LLETKFAIWIVNIQFFLGLWWKKVKKLQKKREIGGFWAD